MLINLQVFKKNRNFSYLFVGQVVSYFGSMITYVAVPYQMYQLTKSSLMVGLLGTVQLVPLIATSLYGGALADSMNRRRLLLASEAVLFLIAMGFYFNSISSTPSVALLFVLSGLSSALNGFHRPAMEALAPQIVAKEDYASIASLNAFRSSFAAVLGPALGGWLISQYGASCTYIIDASTFLFAIGSLLMMRNISSHALTEKAGVSSIIVGLKYALSRQDLIGTYLVDMIAMAFAMPIALFPALSQGLGGAKAAGWLYAGMPMGSLVVSIFSGYSHKIKRHGAAIILAATGWGVAIIALSFSSTLFLVMVSLAFAGGFDAVSAIYRQVLWNETIPSNYRGRLAGVEMLSYMSGPLLGNARAGYIASMSDNFTSIFSGGVLCVIGCLLCIRALPLFWKYRSS